MSGVIAILSKISNLGKELKLVLPNLSFIEIKTELDKIELQKSEIIIADFDLLIPHLNNINQSKWIQGTWAGVDKLLPFYDHEKLNSTLITRFSGKHFGRLMSEYVVANIINHERNLFDVYANQKDKKWITEGSISNHRSLADLNIGILGVGNIGNYIAKILNTFGSKVWGFGRRENLANTAEYKHFIKYCTSNTLPTLLNECDYIVNVLPNTDETTGLLNGNILKNCADKNTVFINIGRGNIINENDLVNALDNKWISAAILDVFQNEPLSKESLLWTYDQVFITPHVAGVSRAKDIAEQFAENLILYKNNKQIPTELLKGEKY